MSKELIARLKVIAKYNSLYWKHRGEARTDCPTCGIDPLAFVKGVEAREKRAEEMKDELSPEINEMIYEAEQDLLSTLRGEIEKLKVGDVHKEYSSRGEKLVKKSDVLTLLDKALLGREE